MLATICAIIVCFLPIFGIVALFSHEYFMGLLSLGLFGLIIYALNPNKKTHTKATVPLLQDSNLDRVRYVQVNFYNWRTKKESSLKWEAGPSRSPGHYEFFIDSRLMVDSMMEKRSVVLYDAYNHVVPIDHYTYSWDELEYPGSDGDGCATLKVFPR